VAGLTIASKAQHLSHQPDAFWQQTLLRSVGVGVAFFIEQLVVCIADRAEEWLSEQGYGADEEGEPDSADGQAVLQAAAVMGRAAIAIAGRTLWRKDIVWHIHRNPLPVDDTSFLSRECKTEG
jgi:hypothetical protein